MRRIRKVHISVSENYYRFLDELKSNKERELKNKFGFNKKLSFPEFTNMLVKKKRIGGLNGDVFKVKPKRRYI